MCNNVDKCDDVSLNSYDTMYGMTYYLYFVFILFLINLFFFLLFS